MNQERATIEQIERYCEIKRNAYVTMATSKHADAQQRNNYLERCVALLDMLKIIRSTKTEVTDILESTQDDKYGEVISTDRYQHGVCPGVYFDGKPVIGIMNPSKPVKYQQENFKK